MSDHPLYAGICTVNFFVNFSGKKVYVSVYGRPKVNFTVNISGEKVYVFVYAKNMY
jgi:hypothetical protein